MNYLKKLVAFVAITIIASTLTSVKTFAQVQSKVKIEVTIGRASRECAGFSICKVSIEWKNATSTQPSFQSEASKSQNGSLVCSIDPSSLSTSVSNTYFSNNTFLIEEDYTLDSATATALGFTNGFTIKRGNYPIVNDATGLLTIAFN